MSVTRWLAATGAIVLAIAVVTPAWAQGNGGRGGGGGNGVPKCVGDGEAYPAELYFHAFQPADEEEPAVGPQIYSSDAGVLYATVNSGNIASFTENVLGHDLPITLDFALGAHGYHQGGVPVDVVDVDPHVSTWVFTDDANLDSVACQMFGMAIGDTYRMRMTVEWQEDEEGPQPGGTKGTSKKWKLRFRPHKDEPRTWLNAVRNRREHLGADHARRLAAPRWLAVVPPLLGPALRGPGRTISEGEGHDAAAGAHDAGHAVHAHDHGRVRRRLPDRYGWFVVDEASARGQRRRQVDADAPRSAARACVPCERLDA